MATVSIQVPMLEMKLPVQTVAKARCRNGWNGDTRVGRTGLVTRPGYPGRLRPAGALLQGGPEGVVRLGGAAEAARALGEHRPGRDRAAGAARGGEHADRAGERRPADRLPGCAHGEVEEAVVVEVVEEEPAGDGRPELVAVLRVGLGDQGPAARAGRRPGQQVDRPGGHVGAEVLAGGSDGQVPLADAVAVGRGHRGAEVVEALGGARDPGGALEPQPLVGQPARGPVEDADRAGGLAAVDRLAGGAGDDVVAGGVVEVAGGHGRPEQVAGLGIALGGHGAEGQAARRAGEQVDRPGVGGGADVLPRGPDHQVGDAVAAQDAAGQGGAEGVARLGGPAGAAALEQGLAAAPGQPGRRTEQDGHGTGVAGGADVLARGADGDVEAAVVVEVARGQRGSELVAGLGVGLGEQRPAGEAAAGAHEDVDRAGGASVPTVSPGAPTARSKMPSPSKSPLATAEPNSSPSSRLPPTPPLPGKNKSGLASSPPAEPYRTLRAPALAAPPTSSPGAPTARSVNPSSLKSTRAACSARAGPGAAAA